MRGHLYNMLTFQTYQTELSTPKAEKIFTLCNGLYKIVKLDDKTVTKLNGGIQAIDVSCSFFPFSRYSLNLAEFYVVLKRLFGESSLSIDSYKQGFSFLFLVAVKNRFLYLFDVCDFRGSIAFRLDKILESGKGDMTYHPFVQGEFSKEEYEQFVELFVGFLEDFSKTYIKKIGTEIQIPPFAHFIESNLYVYGYIDGVFFEKSFGAQDKYNDYVDLLRDKLSYDFDENNNKKHRKIYKQFTEMMGTDQMGTDQVV